MDFSSGELEEAIEMETQEKRKNPSSDYAIRSLLIFFFGCGFGLFLMYVGQVPKNGSWAWISPMMLIGAAVFLAANVAGLWTALTSIIKEESKALGFFALFLNGVPIFSLLALLTQIGL